MYFDMTKIMNKYKIDFVDICFEGNNWYIIQKINVDK